MPSHETLIHRLIDNLELQARTLDEVRRAMGNNRTAFASLSARTLTAGLENLEPHWATFEQLEQKLQQILEEIRDAMQIEGKVRVSRLMRELNAPLAKRLRAAADAADRSSRAVRAETTASARLLRVSQQAHEDIIRAVTGHTENEERKGYDNKAQATGMNTRGGKLLLGTV